LWQVISIPAEIWSTEEKITTSSRENMNSIYEAQQYYYSKTQKFVPADSLEKLVMFLRSDSSLQSLSKLGNLTNQLYDRINQILDVPVLEAILPIIQSLDEIKGDLSFNTRYFKNYDDLMAQKESIESSLTKFESSSEFPDFCTVKNYVDSLYRLRERMNEYKLQNSALLAKGYVDSLNVFLPSIERGVVENFWTEEYQKMLNFVRAIKETDIVYKSSVADRLRKFSDRINSSIKDLSKTELQANVQMLKEQKSHVEELHRKFLEPDNFMLTNKYGVLSLDETDSLLINFSEENFYDPDTFDGQQRYIVAYNNDTGNLTVESPNLLDDFQNKLLEATNPIRDLPLFSYPQKVRNSLDSTIVVMNETKSTYRLNRYQEVLLDMKELIAEMQELNDVLFFRYSLNVKTFLDTVQTERRLSVLKPMIEDILNPIDTLAARTETGNVSDLREKLNEFGNKIQALDSLIQDQTPSRISSRIDPFYDSYKEV
ncbi:MAG: hypothetical protein GWN01_07410, partial [Nitrosopumilaceae archaeon]|nr:hypothetical protein [Nitrosopumilaceae archaeon]NIU87184.1 hypothetical protein [Nitrosopumilaceae archaeon]NIV66625.1 hypothetical protein [Nitrosopumilaceae archaeon]NIX61356.1 hypothetical protein [Nitrosopumilaceae archaeon]